MFRFILCVACLSFIFSTARAQSSEQWHTGIDYQLINSDLHVLGQRIDADMSALSLFVGYEFHLSEKWSVRPTLSIGIGIDDDIEPNTALFNDVFSTSKIELDSAINIASVLVFHLDNKSKLIVKPSIGRYDVVLSDDINADFFSDDDWRVGLGLGYGYRFTEVTSLNLSFELFNDINIAQLGLSWRF